jgi:hypothetical protein
VDAVLFSLPPCISPERLGLTRTITVMKFSLLLMMIARVVDPLTPLSFQKKKKRLIFSSLSVKCFFCIFSRDDENKSSFPLLLLLLLLKKKTS